jgi:hypothetical protein
MVSIKKLCRKAKSKNDWKRLSFDEMIRLAKYFGAEVEPKEGSIYNIYYPNGSTSPSLQLHKPHGSRDDVPRDYKKKFINLFADSIDEEAK